VFKSQVNKATRMCTILRLMCWCLLTAWCAHYDIRGFDCCHTV